MNAWFDRNRGPKMMISVKIVKIGQLQMPVESQQPIMHSDFFRLKHTYFIAEQKNFIWKISAGAIPTKNSQVTIAKCSQSLLSPDGFKP
jgi:hypothetical protein